MTRIFPLFADSLYSRGPDSVAKKKKKKALAAGKSAGKTLVSNSFDDELGVNLYTCLPVAYFFMTLLYMQKSSMCRATR